MPLLPEPLRRAVMLAYLVFRVADTLEDATRWRRAGRLEALAALDDLLARPEMGAAATLSAAWLGEPPCEHPGYLRLLGAMPDLCVALDACPPEAALAIRRHARRTAAGMMEFLRGADESGRLALEGVPDLRRYCYVVAGIVGELLTELIVATDPRLAAIAPSLRELAPRFGEALQLVNILKDSDDDARHGRAYLPAGGDRAAVADLATDALDRAADYIRALHDAGADAGVLKFTALSVLLGRATLERVQAAGAGARLGRAEVMAILRETSGAIDSGRLPSRLGGAPAPPRLGAAPAAASALHAVSERGAGECLRRARAAVERLQRPDGSWEGRNDAGPAFTAITLVCERYLGVLARGDAAAAVDRLRAAQLPDGSLPKAPFAAEGSLEVTCFLLAGLRAAGVPDDDGAVLRARRYVDERGGLGGARLVVRAILAVAGLLPARALPRLPLFHTLVPGFERLAGRLLGLNALLPFHALPALIHGLRAAEERGRRAPGVVAAREAQWAIDYFSARQDPSGGWAGVPFYTLLVAVTLVSLGVPGTDDRIARAVAYAAGAKAADPRLDVVAFRSTLWDTAQLVRGLLAAGAGGGDPAVAAGVRYLVANQSRVGAPRDWQTPPAGAPAWGGWPFQPGNALNPDLDSTAEVLSALVLARRAGAVGLDEAIGTGARFLFAMQNGDGGWAAFSHGKPRPPRGPLFLRRPPPASSAPLARLRHHLRAVSMRLAEIGDPSTADITGRTLYAAGALGLTAADPSVRAAVAFLHAHRSTTPPAWWGRWASNYLPGTAYVLTGLAAVGAAAPSDAPVREAVDWIFSCQNDDGGWGETAASYDDPALAGRGPSSVTVTGAVLWALSAVGHAHTPAAARAARHLVERQAPDGSWSDRHCYGVVFPGLYHYYNDTFPTYLALEGLGAWSAALGPRAG